MAGRAAPLTSGAEGKEIVERGIRDEIAGGALAPGFRLVEADLSERYSVSRNSARLALDSLTAEGLVERIPNKGARVRTVTLEEAVEIMETRMVLDGLLARKAAERATDEEVADLTANLRRMRELVVSGELLTYSNLIQEHHRLVQRAARQPIVASLISRLQGQIVRHQFQLSLRPGRAQQSVEELARVVDAIAEHDADLAEQMGRAHLKATVDALRSEATETRTSQR
jgi:DNA-binding GntR family transcriptional regulator